MAKKQNPLNLNPLQLKTLTLMQIMATLPNHARPSDDGVVISNFPHAHGNHFHLGAGVVSSANATGLGNANVWVALERKGLLKSDFPVAATLTEAGLAYETYLKDAIIHHTDH